VDVAAGGRGGKNIPTSKAGADALTGHVSLAAMLGAENSKCNVPPYRARLDPPVLFPGRTQQPITAMKMPCVLFREFPPKLLQARVSGFGRRLGSHSHGQSR